MSKIGKDVTGKPVRPPKLKQFSEEEKEELRRKWEEIDRPPEEAEKPKEEKPKRKVRAREPTPTEKRRAEAKEWGKRVDEV